MLTAPTPGNDSLRLDALRANYCAYAPREERFDRITRTAKRLLEVPISLISIVEQNEQWFRSVQGLEVDHTARDISFCGHAIALNRPLCIADARSDPPFHNNPLVTGAPGIRAYLGWPLEIAPGLAVGSLCVIDTMPRTFGIHDMDAMRDLASMAQAELTVKAMAGLQGKLMMRLSALQRKGPLDPLTGCWNIRGFRELLAMAVEDARRDGTDLAICSLRVDDLDEVSASINDGNRDALTQMLAQMLRQRLPQGGAMARLGPTSFCALVPADTPLTLKDDLARLSFPSATMEVPGNRLRLDIPLSVCVSWLAELDPRAGPEALWAKVLRSTGATSGSTALRAGV